MLSMALWRAVTAAFLLPCVTRVGSVDLTITAGAVGPEVVEATVQRILLSDIFSDDFSLLRRLAMVETADGTDSAAFAGGLAGGIWKVSEEAFQRTKELTDVGWESYYNGILDGSFGVNWRDVTYSDLQIPVMSALAARIYVLMTSPPVDKVAYEAEEQAAWWMRYYNTEGQEFEFLIKVAELEQQAVCKIGMDVVFALDASLSVGAEGFLRSKNFVKQVVDAFNIGSRDDQTRVGCLQFSHEVTVAFDLGDHDNRDDIMRAVDEIQYNGGGTAMGTAIDYIRQNSFSVDRGARPVEYAVPRIAIILTDGKTNKEFPILFPSALAHREGITMYCIGVGDSDDSELSLIATRPIASHVLHVLNYDSISYLKNIMATRTCRETTAVAVGQPIWTDLEEGEARFISYEIDATEGATIKFMAPSGLVTVYLSSEVPNPNEAVHDYKVEPDGRVDLFIDPTQLASMSRTKRAADDVSDPSHVKVYTAIYARSNGTQLYVESSAGDTADHSFIPEAPSGTVAPVDPGAGPQPAPQLGSNAPPGPSTSVLIVVASLVMIAVVHAQLDF